ncbi:MAG: flagellar protein FlaG [Syntrophomonadaceae bacterium]|jgi:uncharacterized FlaG/YvyC family protein
MTIINGVDTRIVNTIKQKTQKQLVMESGQTKIIGDRQEDSKREPRKGPNPERMRFLLDALNRKMKENNTPICFKLVKDRDGSRIQVIDTGNNLVIKELAPEMLLEMVDNPGGLTLNQTI